jgi:hypothetical protein
VRHPRHQREPTPHPGPPPQQQRGEGTRTCADRGGGGLAHISTRRAPTGGRQENSVAPGSWCATADSARGISRGQAWRVRSHGSTRHRAPIVGRAGVLASAQRPADSSGEDSTRRANVLFSFVGRTEDSSSAIRTPPVGSLAVPLPGLSVPMPELGHRGLRSAWRVVSDRSRRSG